MNRYQVAAQIATELFHGGPRQDHAKEVIADALGSAEEEATKALREEIERLKAEMARVAGISEDESWTLDVPGDDIACVAEYRIRWLRVKMRVDKAESANRALVEALEALRDEAYASMDEDQPVEARLNRVLNGLANQATAALAAHEESKKA